MSDGQAFDRARFRHGYSESAEWPKWDTFDPGAPPAPGTESELTAGFPIVPGRAYGFFTDTTLCIGCKQWNNLPADDMEFRATSYDNTHTLSAETWRHVKFIEQRAIEPGAPRWLMLSDICKHCVNAPCLQACPTGAIVRTEFDSVLIQQDVCNGCKYCVPACPFAVITVNKEADGKAHKCTFCYDRLHSGLEPACAKACPTDSIQFGPLEELLPRARARVTALQANGFPEARLYGDPGGDGATHGIERLNSFFLLMDHPNVYNLPAAPVLPARHILPGVLTSALAAVALIGGMALALLGGSKKG
jgi:formate dehydrogenase iron-sulfur subunit